MYGLDSRDLFNAIFGLSLEPILDERVPSNSFARFIDGRKAVIRVASANAAFTRKAQHNPTTWKVKYANVILLSLSISGLFESKYDGILTSSNLAENSSR